MSTVIKVENLSKQYRLGSVGTGSLVHDLNRTWHRLRGNEDPYLKIGDTNDRTVKGGLHKSVCEIPAHLLNDGIYSVSMMVVGDGSYSIYNFENAVSFEVSEDRQGSAWHGKWPSFVRPNLKFFLT